MLSRQTVTTIWQADPDPRHMNVVRTLQQSKSNPILRVISQVLNATP